MALAASEQSFFVTGGTLSATAPSYIERQADRDLFEFMLAGEFCYVLNSRQMGKSSLSVRTMSRLQESGVRTVFIDLTKLGGHNVTADQWYAGLLSEIGRALDLRQDLVKYFVEHKDVGPMQRVFGALREVALERIADPICIFIDEIDATRALRFSTDEFFAGIREAYNRRVLDPEYKRLTFCMLGVAAPQDLIQDSRTTPFNIGKNIVLRDFGIEESRQLTQGLGQSGQAKLERVMHWTHGQPFLTQTLCAAIAANPDIQSPDDIDRLVYDRFLEKKARQGDVNLSDVANRVLNGYDSPEEIDSYQASVLTIYRRVLNGKKVHADEKDRLITVLRLSGIVAAQDGFLKPRNRIYERVFDNTWVDQNMPGQELRRQKRAFRLGVLRAAAVAAVIIAALVALSGYSMVMASRAEENSRRAGYELYVADANLMRAAWNQNDIDRLRELLDATQDHPAKGWEWSFWNRLANLNTLQVQDHEPGYGPMFSPDGKEIAMRYSSRLAFFDATDGKPLRSFPMDHPSLGFALWSPDGQTVLDSATDEGLYLYDARTGDLKLKIDARQHTTTIKPFSPDGKLLVSSPAALAGRPDLTVWNLSKGSLARKITLPNTNLHAASFTASGRQILALRWDSEGQTGSAFLYDLASSKVFRELNTSALPFVALASPDDKLIATGSENGQLEIWNSGDGARLSATKAHEGTLDQLAWSNDGRYLVTVASDRLARVWRVSQGKVDNVSNVRGASVATFSPDGKRLLAGYLGIRVYDPFTYRESIARRLPEGLKGALRIDPSGEHIHVDAESIVPIDPDTFQPVRLTNRKGIVSDDGRFLLHPTSKDKWVLEEAATKKIVGEMPAPEFAPIQVHVSDNAKRMALVADDRAVLVLDATTGKTIRKFNGGRRLTAADLSPDGNTLLTGGLFGNVQFWSVDTGKLVQTAKGHSRTVTSVKYADQGRRAITTGDDDVARIWDTATGAQIQVFRGHAQTVFDANLSPDGRRLVTASRDLTTKVWDSQTGRELLTLEGHDGEVLSAQFTPDYKSIVTSSANGTIRIWSR